MGLFVNWGTTVLGSAIPKDVLQKISIKFIDTEKYTVLMLAYFVFAVFVVNKRFYQGKKRIDDIFI